jgi:glycosidase
LSQGTAGWRLDAAQNKSAAWWQQFRTAVKAAYPDDILIAEDTAGPIDPTPFILGNEVDGFMNYNFRDAVLSFFTQGQQGSSSGQATTFVNNLMAMVQDYPLPATLSSMNLVDSHDTERVLTDLGGNKAELKLVAAFQMSWLGAPTIYYGDEAGVSGQSDPDDRRTFPWEDQDTDLESYYRQLIAIRKANPVLRDGSIYPLLADNTHRIAAFLRSDEKQKAVIIVNDGTAARTVKFAVPGVANGTKFSDALTGTSYTVSKGALSLPTKAHGISILVTAPPAG